MTDTLTEYRDRISVLSCPINCPWLACNRFGSWCCLLGLKINATVLEATI